MEEEQNINQADNQQVPEELSGMLTTEDGVSIDPFNAPTPGESLTMSPDTKFPWERPPQYTEVRPFIEDIFLAITEEDKYIELLGQYLNNTPIDEITQVILYTSMTSGKINPDLMLLCIEPLMYLLIAIAEQNDIEPVIYEDEDENLDDEQKEIYMDESEKTLKDMKPKEIRKSSVEPSLLAKVKELPTAEELGVDTEQEEEIE
jgi:hypothetical protein